jgi:hypothetical protein
LGISGFIISACRGVLGRELSLSISSHFKDIPQHGSQIMSSVTERTSGPHNISFKRSNSGGICSITCKEEEHAYQK